LNDLQFWDAHFLKENLAHALVVMLASWMLSSTILLCPSLLLGLMAARFILAASMNCGLAPTTVSILILRRGIQNNLTAKTPMIFGVAAPLLSLLV